MSIISFNVQTPMLQGIAPRTVQLVTTDNLATITAAGYMNKQGGVLNGMNLSPSDVLNVLYSYNTSTNTGTFAIFTPTFSASQITLVEWTNPGDVLLPVVSGNIASFNGTTGQIQDSGISAASISSGIIQLGALHQVAVTLTPTQMAAAYATPAQLIANPLASQLIVVHSATVYTASTGNTAYATGTAPIIQYSSGSTNGAHGAGTIATASGLVAGDITAATSQVRTLLQAATAAVTALSGLGIYFSNATGAYTGGTGTNVTFTLVYELLTATV